MRDNFPSKTKEILAKRSGLLCSNPNCRKLTCGPQSEPTKLINIGVAAHISAASIGGSRFDATISAEERRSIENAIWLCQNCAKLIDDDPELYHKGLLRKWKLVAEKLTLKRIGENYSTDFDWKNSLSRQLTSFSRVEFVFPYIKIREEQTENEFIQEWTRVIAEMICYSYLDLVRDRRIEELVFGLSLEMDKQDSSISFSGELITHVTAFAYRFGEFVNLLHNRKFEELFEEFGQYPKINIKRYTAFGSFKPYKISRVNPAKVFIDYIEKNVYNLKGDLTTSQLLLFLSSAANGRLFILDDQNETYQLEKISRLLDEIEESFDMTEIWINPDDPEKWSFN